MINLGFRPSFLLLVTIACFGLAGVPRKAQAQSVFCPAAVSNGLVTVPGITLSNGACTNPAQPPKEAGAYSGAALAGQAVGNLAQSMSIVETSTATRQIDERRVAEERICPPGQTLIGGICRAAVTPAAPVVSATPVVRPTDIPVVQPSPKTIAARHPIVAGRPVARRRVAVTSPRVAPVPVTAPPLPPAPSLIIPAHWGAWAQGFGDYEQRSGHGSSQIQCCSAVGAIPLGLNATSATTTAGFVGGVDWTSRNLHDAGDGLILGVMAGYLDSSVQVNTSVLSTMLPAGPTGVGNGTGIMRAHLSGPSVGVYATYFDGPWSNDVLIKNDFLDLNESFSALQSYQTCPCATFTPFSVTHSGTGTASLNEFTVSDNVHYRIPLAASVWAEPTVGVQYTLSSYSGTAAALGLKDGDLVRLQGGARIGEDIVAGSVPVTLAVTGLVYDDVLVSGDFIQGGAFGTSGNILNDQGKVRGEGILDAKFDLGNGRSVFLQGDVRGGDSLFGGGGKGGFRIEW